MPHLGRARWFVDSHDHRHTHLIGRCVLKHRGLVFFFLSIKPIGQPEIRGQALYNEVIFTV